MMTDRNLPEAAPSGMPYSRRRFLTTAGLLAGAGVLTLQSCSKDDDSPAPADGTIVLGTGDSGVLHYLYLLKHLTSAYYQQVLETPYGGMSALETSLLTDMAAQEKLHLRLLDQLLTRRGVSGLRNPGTNFSTIAFSDRTKVLTVARTLEDLGVAAYNGAGPLLADPALLLAAGKMASVTARHAAMVRDMLLPGSFAALGTVANYGALPAQGLDAAMLPAEVLDQAGKYFQVRINPTNLPNQ